jgi:peptide/nickel transport system substrate-binding protein
MQTGGGEAGENALHIILARPKGLFINGSATQAMGNASTLAAMFVHVRLLISEGGTTMRRSVSLWFLVGIVMTCLAGEATAQRPPEGQLIIALTSSLAPVFFDPSEPGLTPLPFLYALHDALFKPLPGNPMAPALAESWTESPDGLVYDVTLRTGLTFHNGDPFTAEDVKFSFLRYKGISAPQLHERVKAIDILDPSHLRIVLHAPWPDFLTVYSALVSRAAWVVPKQYIERVGDEGFQRHPIGLGPYRFVRLDPGVALVLEAYDRYWRKTPAIQQIIFKSVPEPSTRLAMLKTGEADIVWDMVGDEGAAITADPQLRLVGAGGSITEWLEFLDQWDPTSPWHDRRVRLAANLAIDKQVLCETVRHGCIRLTGSIIPRTLAFALPLEPFPYDPAQAKRLLAEAGYPQGVEGGDLTPFPPLRDLAEGIANNLLAVGIRTQVRSLERPAWQLAWRKKQLKGLVLTGSFALGNVASLIETFVLGTGTYAYSSYPDLDVLFQQQAVERDRTAREALLHRMQSLMHERVMHAPLFEPQVLHGVGPRVEESTIGLILFPVPVLYEEMRLKRP